MNRFSSFDGLRGVFALAVVLFHLDFATHFFGLPALRAAYLSVDFFFVLSGFVIAHAYDTRLRTAADAGDFIVRRIGRVWPLHIATLAVLVELQLVKLALTLHGNAPPSSDAAFSGVAGLYPLLTNIFLLHSLDLHDQLTWNHPSWSISAEFVAYLLFAGVLIWLRRWALLAAALIVGVSMAIIVKFSTTGMDLTYHLGAVRGCAGFFLGWLTYAGYRRFATGYQLDRNRSFAVEVFVVAIVIAYLSIAGRSAFSYLAPFLFAGALCTLAITGGPFTAFLNSRPLQFLGVISYSIYMTHYVLITIMDIAVHGVEQSTKGTLFVPGVSLYGPIAGDALVISWHGPYVMDALTLVYLAAVIGVSWLTWRYIETPGKAAFAALLARRQLRKAAGATAA